jgi:hypothetical protein
MKVPEFTGMTEVISLPVEVETALIISGASGHHPE